MDIGFIGLGEMGKAMAANLLKAGHTVRVWNRSPGPAEELAGQGATVAASAKDAFAGDAVLSMLADDNAVRSAIMDAGLIESAPKSLVHVNLATISVAFAKELAQRHLDASVGYVAAPVFGRPEVAAAAKLNIVAAGDPAALATVQPLLDAIGQKTWPVGDTPERANVVKIAGNFLIATVIESLAESLTLAKSYGIAEADILEILTGTLFNAPVYKTYGALIAGRQYEPAAFKLSLGLKDVRLALQAGEHSDVPLPIASLLRDNFLDAIAHGDKDKDWSALADVSYRRAGLDEQS